MTAYVAATEERFVAVGAAARARLDAADRTLVDQAHRIARRTHAAVERADERLGVRIHRLRSGATRPLDAGYRHLDHVAGRLAARVPGLLDAEVRHIANLEARVRNLDPVNVLARGWSITRGADGRALRDPADVAAGDVITTQLAAGTVRSRVEPNGGTDT